jgi:hypothetical protein
LALPSKKQQIEQVARFLDADRNEGRTLDEIAKEIVEGFHEMLLSPIMKPATPLRSGMLLKSPYDAKVRRVAWLNDEAGRVWIVSETSSYGWLGPSSPPTWEYCEEFRPKKRLDGKMVEMTDEMIEDAWKNPEWYVGERLSQHQREFIFEVIATAPQCVLMRNVKTGALCADSNKSLEQYYRRESNLGSEW